VLLLGKVGKPDELEALLFGSTEALDAGGLIPGRGGASATLIALALFLRGVAGRGGGPGVHGARWAPVSAWPICC